MTDRLAIYIGRLPEHSQRIIREIVEEEKREAVQGAFEEHQCGDKPSGKQVDDLSELVKRVKSIIDYEPTATELELVRSEVAKWQAEENGVAWAIEDPDDREAFGKVVIDLAAMNYINSQGVANPPKSALTHQKQTGEQDG